MAQRGCDRVQGKKPRRERTKGFLTGNCHKRPRQEAGGGLLIGPDRRNGLRSVDAIAFDATQGKLVWR